MAPLISYDCSISSYNTKQNCDVYVFTRVQKDFSRGWILGYMNKNEYFDKAVYLKKGEIDNSNNFTVKSNCYNIKISELYDINELILR